MWLRSGDSEWTCAPAPTEEVRAFHTSLPGYAPTPLVEIPAEGVFVKDESDRFGLPAFKALGASYAIHRILAEQPDANTLVTASDGNHGRAVARVARLLGRRAHIFVPAGVHPLAVAAIRAEDATVTELDGSYDDAVRAAAGVEDAVLVQDMAWPGYEKIPGWIVDGYSTLCAELDEQLPAPPDLVVIPAGVGSLAQAVVRHYRSRTGHHTRLVTVEPTAAAGVLASLRADEPTTVDTAPTVMAGLNCGTPSSLAWPYLRHGLDAAVAVDEDAALRATRDLAGFGVNAGPCGAASLAGLRAVRPHFGPLSTVVLLSTEGAAANPYTEGIPA